MENVRPNPSCKFTVKFRDRVVVKSSGLNACVVKEDKQKGEAVVAVAGKAGFETYKMGQLVFVKSSSVACTSWAKVATTARTLQTKRVDFACICGKVWFFIPSFCVPFIRIYFIYFSP